MLLYLCIQLCTRHLAWGWAQRRSPSPCATEQDVSQSSATLNLRPGSSSRLGEQGKHFLGSAKLPPGFQCDAYYLCGLGPVPPHPIIQTHPLGLAGIGLGAKHAGAVNIKHPAQGLAISERSVKGNSVQTVLERPWAGSHKPSHFREWQEGLATVLPGCRNRPAGIQATQPPEFPVSCKALRTDWHPSQIPLPNLPLPTPTPAEPSGASPGPGGPWGRGWADPAAHLELGSTLYPEELKAPVLPLRSPQARHSPSSTLHGAGSHPGRLP